MRTRTVRAAPELLDGGRGDVLIHALAQLPESVRAEIPAAPEEAERLSQLCHAYGIGERASFSTGAEEADLSLAPARGASRSPRDALSAASLDWLVSGGEDEKRTVVGTLGELVEAIGASAATGPVSRPPDDELAGERIAAITNFPTHYRVPLWNRVARELERVGAELVVLSSQPRSDPARSWLRHEGIEFAHRPVTDGALGRTGRELSRALRSLQPSLILSGGFDPLVTGRALRHANAQRIPFGLWSGDTTLMETAQSSLRRPLRRWIARRSDFGLAYGWLAAEYLRELAASFPVVIARNTAPIFEARSPENGGGSPRSETVEVLTVGQAIPRKRLDVAVDAFARLRDVPGRLTVAGGGPELDELVARAGGSERIRFLGPVGSERILDLYRQTDVFLFPSEADVFGLVLVEAMGSGVATITSSSPASVADLCVDGRNSIVLRTHDPAAWAEAIARLVRNSDLRRELGSAGARTVRDRWTIEHSADAWIAGIRLGLQQARLNPQR